MDLRATRLASKHALSLTSIASKLAPTLPVVFHRHLPGPSSEAQVHIPLLE